MFHLAAVVSGRAERDFDLGMRVNLDAARLVLEACRSAGSRPRVLFTSSVAVYGGDLPDMVTDATALTPRSSYGVQKAIGELMLVDYCRKGFVDGCIARLPTISVRPGRPNQAASSFASGIVREPLNGEQAVCPVAPETRLWLLSPRRAIGCLIAMHDLDDAALGINRSVNLPGGVGIGGRNGRGGPCCGRRRSIRFDSMAARPCRRAHRRGMARSVGHRPCPCARTFGRPGFRSHRTFVCRRRSRD